MPELTIFITTFNRHISLRDTLRRLVAVLDRDETEIMVHDDASTDGTPDVCAEFGDRVRVLSAARNIGCIEARNLGVRAAAADLVLFLDDDSYLLDRGAVRRIRALFRDHPRCAVLAANIATRAVPAGLDDPDAPPYETASYIGCGHVIRRSALAGAPPYAEFLAGYGHEEIALSLRLLDAGWSVVFDPGLRVFHAEDPSQRPSMRRTASLFTNEIATVLAVLPWILWLPLGANKLVSHWRANWKGNAFAVLGLLVRELPRSAMRALRSRKAVRLGTYVAFMQRRRYTRARWRAWRRSTLAGAGAGARQAWST
jgi:GT2 family glycosyltransferase